MRLAALLTIGEKREFALGKDAINVEEEKFDFAGVDLSGEFGRRDFSRVGEVLTATDTCEIVRIVQLEKYG